MRRVFGVLALVGLLFALGGCVSDEPSEGEKIGPHDGKTQAQVDKDQKDIETMREAAKQIQNGK